MEMNDQQRLSQVYDPARFLDALALHTGVSGDAGLAKALQISKHLLAWIRQRRYPVSATLLLQIHDATGLSVRELRDLVGDRRRAVRMSDRRVLSPEERVKEHTRRLT